MGPPLSQTFLTGLECLRCGQFFLPESVDYVCPCRPNRGSDLGHLDVVYDYEAVASMRNGREVDVERANLDRTDSRIGGDAPWSDTTTRSIERWWPLLPVRPDSLPPLPVGDTPLLRANRLAGAIGLKNLYIKDDARNPSGSFKDRASAIAVARARETGREVIATASTGNAAAALAAMGASAADHSYCHIRSPLGPAGQNCPAPGLWQPRSGGRRILRRRLRSLCARLREISAGTIEIQALILS